MTFDNKKLRKLLEEDPNAGSINQADVEAVASMLSVLEHHDNTIKLPDNFSERVIQKVMRKQVRENRFGWLGILVGIIGLTAALIVSLALVDFKLDFGFLKGISSYSGLFLFGIAFILILNMLEKKIIRISSE